MRTFVDVIATAALLLSANGAATLSKECDGGATENRPPANVTEALAVAEVAEIYVIGREISFPAAPTPQIIRQIGCHYVVHRAHYLGDSPAWRDLSSSLARADIRFLPTKRRGELRIGLVLSDWRGTLRETYLADLPQASGRLDGLDQRRQVEVPASFVEALLGFVERHRDHALPDGGLTPRCPPRPTP